MDAATGRLTNLDDDHADGGLLPPGAGQTPSGDFTLPVSPTFTPDGTHVTYSRSSMRGAAGRQRDRTVAGRRRAAAAPRRVDEQMGVVWAAWPGRPDGRTLYFTRVHPDEHDPARGSGRSVATARGCAGSSGSPTPSSERRASSRSRRAAMRCSPSTVPPRAPWEGRPTYALVDVATGAVTPLLVSGETRPPLAGVAWAGFSPDGSWLVETTPLEHRVLLRNVDDATEIPLVPEGLRYVGSDRVRPRAHMGERRDDPADRCRRLRHGDAAGDGTAITITHPRFVADGIAGRRESRGWAAGRPAHGRQRRVRAGRGDQHDAAGLHPLRGRQRHLPPPSPAVAVARGTPAAAPARAARRQQVEELLAFALGPGGLRDAKEQYYDPTVMDAPFTVFDIDVPGLTKQVSVYALGINEQAPDAADRARLADLAEVLGSFDAQVAAGKATPEGDYHPDRYRGILTPASQSSSQPARPWPFPTSRSPTSWARGPRHTRSCARTRSRSSRRSRTGASRTSGSTPRTGSGGS